MRRMWSFGRTVALIGVAASAAYSLANAANTSECPQLEIVAVEDQGARTVTGPDGNALHIASAPLLSMPDFTSANVSLTEGQIVLNLNLSRQSGERIQAFSRAHVGRHLAFIVEGKVIRVAKILDPILGDGIMISPLEKIQATELAERVNAHAKNCGSDKN